MGQFGGIVLCYGERPSLRREVPLPVLITSLVLQTVGPISRSH